MNLNKPKTLKDEFVERFGGEFWQLFDRHYYADSDEVDHILGSNKEEIISKVKRSLEEGVNYLLDDPLFELPPWE